MRNPKSSIRSSSLERGSLASGFVIDLRSNVPSANLPKPLSLKQKHSTKKTSIFQKMTTRHKKIHLLSPNLLAIDKQRFYDFNRFLDSLGQVLAKLLKASLKKNSRKLLKSSRHVGKSWLRYYQSRLRDFQEALDDSSRFLRKKIIKKLPFSRRRRILEEKLLIYRSLWSFLVVLILIVVPFKLLAYFQIFDLDKLEDKIMTSSQSAFSNLLAAGGAAEQLDFQAAGTEFQKAAGNFLEAQSELDKIGDTLLFFASLSDNPKIKMASEGKKFLQSGAIVSSFGFNFASASNSLFDASNKDISSKLDGFIRYGLLASADAKQLEKELSKIDPDNLPIEYRQKFNELKQQIALVSSSLESFIDSADKLQKMLGISEDKRYLLVFQNNAELRASGGFLGSYALVDVRDGQIRNLEIPGGGSYDVEGGMNIRVIAPRPLWLINTLWHFWDANWWPDWPKTAENLMWFYEKSGGPTVDGVISLTPSVIEDLLRITGPIDLQSEYGLTIDADNFWETVQVVVEKDNLSPIYPALPYGAEQGTEAIKSTLPLNQDLERNSDNKPKKIIGDLAVRILEVLPEKINKDSLVQILSLFEQNLSSKQVLFYFKDDALQQEFSKRNWSGEIKESDRDYLAVIHTNIAGQKSDRKIIDNIEHLSEISDDGQIINTVKITRSHTGSKNEPLHGVRNVDWLRVYVPLGSRLISATGFVSPDEEYLQDRPEEGWQEHSWLREENQAEQDQESNTLIYSDSGKTVFANWLMVDPGESATVVIRYQLPFNFFESSKSSSISKRIIRLLNNSNNFTPHSLLVQKQAGAPTSLFSSTLKLPVGKNVSWSYPEDIRLTNGWKISDDLNSDHYWSILSQ